MMRDEVAERVAQVMRDVRRADFLPELLQQSADVDSPLPIGGGQTSSQPRTVAAMLRLLEPRAGHRVLDVGAGSGWTTALLARLVGPEGWVVGVELDPGLAEWGADNLAAYAMSWAELHPAEPGVLGRPDLSPFDRILVSAEAHELPGELLDQLGFDAVMVVPVSGRMCRVARARDGTVTLTRHGRYRFVPLR
ncbi:MAG: protein-L-isoaspartate carboxylmethyltransferase [Nocardioidaceae bacterium]